MQFRNLFILALLIVLGGTSFVRSQETALNNSDSGQKIAKTELIDEFGRAGNCELSARVHNVFVTYLQENPNSKAYFIIYRDAGALPADRSVASFAGYSRRIQDQIAFLRHDKSKAVIVDGGFREFGPITVEVWLVPEGGQIPVPTLTVEPKRLPLNRAYKVASPDFSAVWDARLEKPEEVYIEEVEEAIEFEAEPEIETEDEYYKPFWISDFFFTGLNENKSLKGVIIFYLDVEEYDLGKVYQIMNEDLREYTKQTNQITMQARIVFGGYREDPTVEYWFVPRGAKDPIPTPEIKKLEESKK